MIIYEEVYRVKITKTAEYQELLSEFEEMINELDLPYLLDWYTWQERYTPGAIRNVWVVENYGDIEKLWEECFMQNEKWIKIVPKIFELMVDGSYNYSFWKPLAGKQR